MYEKWIILKKSPNWDYDVKRCCFVSSSTHDVSISTFLIKLTKECYWWNIAFCTKLR